MASARSALRILCRNDCTIFRAISSKNNYLKGSLRSCSNQVMQLKDSCCLVDQSDNVIGSMTKEECHRRVSGDLGKLHRAFSVFLFNSENKLLLQQRSSSKITFPNFFTNTCCSHPRYEEDELVDKAHRGIKLAAQRRMEFELGIPKEQMPLESFKFLTKIHYQAPSDTTWAESEIDHVLLMKADVHLNVNPNEVQHIRYVDQVELTKLLEDALKEKMLITPWFQFIADNFLFNWWEHIDSLDNEGNKGQTIHRAGIIK